MKVLITGASGFLGGQLVQAWSGKGYDLRALVRRSSRVAPLQGKAELWFGDVNDPDSLKPALKGMEAVVHCASMVGEDGRREDFWRVNVEGTRNLLDAAEGLGLKRFVHISSLSVITGYKDHHGTKEDAPYRPTGEPYADTKIEAEKLVLQYHRRYELPTVILRPGFIYGPGDRVFLPTVLRNLREGKVKLIDHGKKLLNLTYVGNLIDAIELALLESSAVGQIFNITDGEKVSKKAFFDSVADLAGLPRPTRSVPFPVAKALTLLVSGAYRLFGAKKTPPLTRMKLRFAGQNQWFDTSKAESRLGFKPKIPFAEAIKKAIEWNSTLMEPGGQYKGGEHGHRHQSLVKD